MVHQRSFPLMSDRNILGFQLNKTTCEWDCCGNSRPPPASTAAALPTTFPPATLSVQISLFQMLWFAIVVVDVSLSFEHSGA